MTKLTLNNVHKKHLRILSYLLASGVLGAIAVYITKKPELGVMFGAAINYAMYAINQELQGEGYTKVLQK